MPVLVLILSSVPNTVLGKALLVGEQLDAIADYEAEQEEKRKSKAARAEVRAANKYTKIIERLGSAR